MRQALLIWGFLVAFSKATLAMDASLGEMITVQVEGSPVLWTGDGFSLNCSLSATCVVNTSQLGLGTFRIIFSRTDSGNMEFGEINLSVTKPVDMVPLDSKSTLKNTKTSEISTGLSGQFRKNKPFTASIKKFAFLERELKTKTIKDFPVELQPGDKISSLPDSVVFTRLETNQSAILLGQAEILIQSELNSSEKTNNQAENPANQTLYYQWLKGSVLFQLKKGKKLRILEYNLFLDQREDKHEDQADVGESLVLVSPHKNGFVVVPIKGKFAISSDKISRTEVSPSFAVLLEGRQKTFLSLTSCDDAVIYLKQKMEFQDTCYPFNLQSDLLFDPKLLDMKNYTSDSQHLESIYQEWLEDLVNIPLTIDQRFDLQIYEGNIPVDRYDLKLRALLIKNQCSDIFRYSSSSPKEERFRLYYEGLCFQRQRELGLAANRWSWLLQKTASDEAEINSIFSQKNTSHQKLKKGFYSLFLGLDTNATRKGSDVELSPFKYYDDKKYNVIGLGSHMEDVLSTEGSLKFFFSTDAKASIYLAQSNVVMSDYTAQVSLPLRFSSHKGDDIEFKPKVIAKANGAPLDNIGLGLEVSYKKDVFSSSIGLENFEDFNNNIEIFDPISGNALPLKTSSDRPYRDHYLGLGFHTRLSKVELNFYLKKYSSKYRFDVEDNQSFDSWQFTVNSHYIVMPLFRLEGAFLLEARGYKGDFSGARGTQITADLTPIWDFNPDYSAFAKIQHISSKSDIPMGGWSKNIYLMGVRREFR